MGQTPQIMRYGRQTQLTASCARRLGMSCERFVAHYDPCASDLQHYARRLCRGTHLDPDDLVQESLLKAWRARHSYAEGTSFRAWLFVILRNQFLDERRVRGSRETSGGDLSEDHRATFAPAQLHAIELRDVLRAMADLHPSQRLVLWFAARGDSYAEIARHTGAPLGTVRSRLSRAREALRGRRERSVISV